MKRVRMILVLVCVVVVVTLVAVIFVLTRGDEASPPEPCAEAAQSEASVSEDEPIAVVVKDNGQPASSANGADGQREEVIEEPPEEVEQPESPEKRAAREEKQRKRDEAFVEAMAKFSKELALTPEQIEAAGPVVDRFADVVMFTVDCTVMMRTALVEMEREVSALELSPEQTQKLFEERKIGGFASDRFPQTWADRQIGT